MSTQENPDPVDVKVAVDSDKAAPRQKINLEELDYVDRHIVKHLRRTVDKQIEKQAWASCDEFARELHKCQKEQGFLGPIKCQGELDVLKVCMNRYIVSYRESHPPIVRPPPAQELLKPSEKLW